MPPTQGRAFKESEAPFRERKRGERTIANESHLDSENLINPDGRKDRRKMPPTLGGAFKEREALFRERKRGEKNCK